MGGWGRLGLAGVFAILCAASPAWAQTQRAEVPIREVVLSDGEHRYVVSITVGDAQIDAGLDSGSTGLRILPGTIPAGSEQPSGRRNTYSYDSGTEFSGVIAEADMTIGVSGRAKFQQIEKVGCRPVLRTCPASKVKPEQFGIQGSGLPGEGFKAILGINMASDDAPNPLVALGVRRWIIELPRPGEGKPGRLVLNPSDEEVADYKVLAIDGQFGDQRGGLHDAVQGCLVNQANNRSYCGPTDLDTGAPGIQIATSEATDRWAPQAPVTMAFYQKGKAAVGAAFAVGDGPGARVTIRSEPRARGSHIFLGILPYFAFSVLYDPHGKSIALKPR
jgi:hypothetical protein